MQGDHVGGLAKWEARPGVCRCGRRKRSPAGGMSGSHRDFGSVCDEPEVGGLCASGHRSSHPAITEECIVRYESDDRYCWL